MQLQRITLKKWVSFCHSLLPGENSFISFRLYHEQLLSDPWNLSFTYLACLQLSVMSIISLITRTEQHEHLPFNQQNIWTSCPNYVFAGMRMYHRNYHFWFSLCEQEQTHQSAWTALQARAVSGGACVFWCLSIRSTISVSSNSQLSYWIRPLEVQIDTDQRPPTRAAVSERFWPVYPSHFGSCQTHSNHYTCPMWSPDNTLTLRTKCSFVA